jgi:hypothetical protein
VICQPLAADQPVVFGPDVRLLVGHREEAAPKVLPEDLSESLNDGQGEADGADDG